MWDVETPFPTIGHLNFGIIVYGRMLASARYERNFSAVRCGQRHAA